MGQLDKLVMEADHQKVVTDLANLLRWRWYHANNPLWDNAGLPDLELVKPPRVIKAELKRVGKHPTVKQMEYLIDYWLCDIETYVWTHEYMDEIEDILRHKRVPAQRATSLYNYLKREGHRYPTLDISKVTL